MRIKRWGLPGLLLFIHVLLMGHAARNLSPTWDEIVYPVAGVTLWRTRTLTLASGAPFLSELLCALPLLPLQPSLPQDGDSKETDQNRLGYEFTFHNKIPAGQLIFLARLPAMAFSLMTALLMFLWIRSLWGEKGALTSLVCYATTPLILSRANLALLEMPAFFFALLALCLHELSSRKAKPIYLYGAGVATGLALLCKMICAPLLLVFLILQRKRMTDFLKLALTALGTFVLFYLPWHDPWGSINRVISFSLHFNQIMPPYYWHGQQITNPPSILSWAAMVLKAPLFVWGLSLWGAYAWQKSQKQLAAFKHLFIFLAVFLAWPVLFSRAVSTIQFGIFYLALVGLAGGLAALLAKPRKFTPWIFGLMIMGAVIDGWHGHPNYLAYFNALSGGSDAGFRWLSDSDQDWGQALPQLAEYVHAHGDPNVLLAYSGAADPRAFGLRFQDLLSPALYSRETQGEKIGNDPRPIWIAMATKVIQSEPDLTDWLQKNGKPQAMVGSCFFIYDVTKNPEAFRWMGIVYASTRRRGQARWAFERAQALDPGNPIDQKALHLL